MRRSNTTATRTDDPLVREVALPLHHRPPVRATLSCEGWCEMKQHYRPPVRATLSYEGVVLLYHRRPPVRATLSCEGRCEVKQRCGPPVRATPLVREAALLQHHRPPVRATLSYEGVVLPSGSLLNVTGPLLTSLRSSSMGCFPVSNVHWGEPFLGCVCSSSECCQWVGDVTRGLATGAQGSCSGPAAGGRTPCAHHIPVKSSHI